MDRQRNETYRNLKMNSVEQLTEECQLIWFRHVRRIEIEE